MRDTFRDKLDAAVARNNSLLCVGLDPDPAMMPVEDVVEFCGEVIDATADLVCSFKPNIAFFEQFGGPGWEMLQGAISAIPDDIPVLIDAKRGDIGNTAQAYARAVFDLLGADAMTVNAWAGYDAVEPFLEYSDRGVFVFCRSSNPSARDFQDLTVDYEGTRRPLWQAMALRASAWNAKHGNVGLVMGATYPRQLTDARRLCPEVPILVPGIGAQEGALKEAVRAGLKPSRDGILVSASRSIIYASRGSDYALACRAMAAQLREQINRHREDAPVRAEV